MPKRSLAEEGGDHTISTRWDTRGVTILTEWPLEIECLIIRPSLPLVFMRDCHSFREDERGTEGGRRPSGLCGNQNPSTGIVGFLLHSIISPREDSSASSWITTFPQLRAT